LAVVGQASALQLILAGPLSHYQHYRYWHWLVRPPYPYLLGFIGLQAIVVAYGIGSRWSAIRGFASTIYRPWQLLLICGIFWLPANTVHRDPGFYASELLLAGAIQVVNLGNVALAAWSIPTHALRTCQRRVAETWSRRSPARWLRGPALIAAGLDSHLLLAVEHLLL
jgi:hypothetical protein